MTTLYLIRHAEAEGNVYRRLHGQYDSHITPNGRKQIAALEKRFADIKIDAVYASDLLRTRTTAEAIYKAKNLPLRPDPRFRELNCGVWEDIPFGYLDHFYPEENRNFSKRPKLWSAEGSETFYIYTDRFLEAMEEVTRRHEGQTVAIFSHGMVMRGVQQRLFFPEIDDLPHSENTAVSKLIWDKGAYTAEFLNDASHLPPEISTLGRQQWWRGGDHKDFNMWFRDETLTEAVLPGDLPRSENAIVRISMLKDAGVGAVALSLPQGEEAHLEALYLKEEYRGRGLSAQLLGEAVSIARQSGKKTLTVSEAEIHPAAAALLRAYGFRKGHLGL